MGVAVMKTDFAEDMPDDAVPFRRQAREQLHNLYPLLYQRACSRNERVPATASSGAAPAMPGPAIPGALGRGAGAPSKTWRPAYEGR